MQVEAAESETGIHNERGAEHVRPGGYDVVRHQVAGSRVSGRVSEADRIRQTGNRPQSEGGWRQRERVLLGETGEESVLAIDVIVDAEVALVPGLAEHG